jgi:hypothetical protein
MKPTTLAAFAFAVLGGWAGAAPTGESAKPRRVTVTGEIIDSWCQVSQIMGVGAGTAHHQCAIWCAVGGIPVGIQADDGKVYILLKVDPNERTVRNPTVINMQTDHVTVDADLYERSGVSYLVVEKVVADDGIVNLNHKEFGIVPFGE